MHGIIWVCPPLPSKWVQPALVLVRDERTRRGVRSGHSFPSLPPCQVLTWAVVWDPLLKATGPLTKLQVSRWENSFLSLLMQAQRWSWLLALSDPRALHF